MADINRDLDRYLRKRRTEQSGDGGPSFFDRMFSGASKHDNLSSHEEEEIEAIEHDLKKGEEQIEKVHEIEEELEERQEREVSFYHRMLRWFRQSPDHEHEEHIELSAHDAAPVVDDHATDDVRTLSEISMKWLSRLPTRIKDEFKASEDYTLFTGILERRGIAKKK